MKKAKLDLLEDIPIIEAEVPSDQQIELDHGIQEESNDKVRKWAFNKLMIIFAPVVLIVLFVSGLLIYQLNKQTMSDDQKPYKVSQIYPEKERTKIIQESDDKKGKNITAGSIFPLSEETWNVIYLKDFMIDLRDSKGKVYVLMCDVVFNIKKENKPDQFQDKPEIRDIVYRVARNRSALALMSLPNERKKMKMELASEFEKILGKGSVKNVYFMNFFIM